jgi:hypothetical protein
MTARVSAKTLLLAATALLSTTTIQVQAQPPYGNPAAGAIVGGVLGIIGGMVQQQQQQQLLQQQAQQQQQAIQRQQQIEADHQRAVAAAQAEAQEQARQRQQAAADARARQQQAAAKAAADAKGKADADERHRLEAANKLRADPVFATILGTDDQDITVLIVGADTPNVIRNLKGDPVFQNGATACLPFGMNGLDQKFLATVKKQIEQKSGLVGTSLLLTSCNPADLAGYEAVIFSRSQVAGGTVDILDPLADALRSRQFVTLSTYAIADSRTAEITKAEAERQAKIQDDAARLDALKSFQARDPSVVSVIHTEAPAGLVCLAASPDPEGVRYMLKRTDSPFAHTITANSVIRAPVADADAVFLAFKRHDCTAAAAPAGILRDVMAGLIRDGFKVEVDAGVITTDQLASWKVMSAQELADAQQKQKEAAEAERQRETRQQVAEQDQVKLDAQRRANDEAARREELDRMRAQVASRANAVADDLSKKIQRHIASVVTEVNDTKLRAQSGWVLSAREQADLQAKYAVDRLDFDTWPELVANLVKQGWEISAPQVGIEDYGRAQSKQRTIEAITVRMEFPIVNRVIGERKTVCEAFTFIDDDEFQFIRQPQAVSCDDYARTFDQWAQGNAFVSQWKLLQPTG